MKNVNVNTSESTPASIPPTKKMSRAEAISILQLAANRLNAQKSCGPKSEESKDRVKYNALRHGFTGQVLVMPIEERPIFDAFIQGMMNEFAPVGTNETFLANSIAEDSWRINQMRARCSNLEAACTFEGAGDDFLSPEGQTPQIEDAVVDAVIARDRAKELALLSTYLQRTQRGCERHKKELFEVQERRKARREAEFEEARLLYQLAEIKGLAFNPKENGFDFSLAEVRAHTKRFHILNKAKRSDKEYRDQHYPIEITRSASRAA